MYLHCTCTRRQKTATQFQIIIFNFMFMMRYPGWLRCCCFIIPNITFLVAKKIEFLSNIMGCILRNLLHVPRVSTCSEDIHFTVHHNNPLHNCWAIEENTWYMNVMPRYDDYNKPIFSFNLLCWPELRLPSKTRATVGVEAFSRHPRYDISCSSYPQSLQQGRHNHQNPG